MGRAAKDAYVDLKTLLQKYCNDYQVSVQNLTTCVEGLDNLINEIPSANVIKEIDNMKKLTLEALYTLHLMNDKSNDLPFIPLSQLNSDENRKSQLQKALQKGYKDLENIGLIQDGQPTAEFVAYGYF